MQINEFENWYNSKKRWLEYKSKYLISTNKGSFSDVNELISLTIEQMLINLENINIETVDSYCFLTMKNMMYNKILYPYKHSFCCDDFTNYDEEDVPYKEEISNFELNYTKNKEILQKHVSLNKNKKIYQIASLILKGKTNKEIENMGYNRGLIAATSNIKINNAKSNTKGVVRKDENNNFKYYPSVLSVKTDGFDPSTVSKCVLGKIKKHKGYTWEYIKQ